MPPPTRLHSSHQVSPLRDESRGVARRHVHMSGDDRIRPEAGIQREGRRLVIARLAVGLMGSESAAEVLCDLFRFQVRRDSAFYVDTAELICGPLG